MHRLTFHDAATTLGMTYEQVRRRVQCGELEAGEPLDGKHAVSYRSVVNLAARLNRELPEPLDLEQFEALRPGVTLFHKFGVERAAFLRGLEADALEAEHRGDLGAAAVLWQLVAGLTVCQYSWNADRGTWRVSVPFFGAEESQPAPVPVSKP